MYPKGAAPLAFEMVQFSPIFIHVKDECFSENSKFNRKENRKTLLIKQ